MILVRFFISTLTLYGGRGMRQVLISLCVICKSGSLSCYDSEREPKKIFCEDCTEKRCPIPTQPFSHGFCSFHTNEIRSKRNAKNNNEEATA
jgi:hypothetical protein